MGDREVHDGPTASLTGGGAVDSRVAHLVLTGGPCAGKTSALAHLVDQLSVRGWRVLTVPEAATLLITGGVHDIGALAGEDRDAYLGVQRQLVGLQHHLHGTYDRLARALPQTKTVVLHDRGIADNQAYMTGPEYGDVLAGVGLDGGRVHELYDGVLYLRSAAVPGDGYDGGGYTRANNVARREDATAAAALDEATLAGWSGHPHLAVVASTGSFGAKLNRVLDWALRLLGDPEPVEAERKFALAGAPDLSHPVLASAVAVDIEQVYLPTGVDGREQRLRARMLSGVTTYTHTTKVDAGEGVRVEVETPIGAHAYQVMCGLRDPGTQVIRKTRYLFVDGAHRFELDHIRSPREVWMLEVELVDLDEHVVLPDWLPPLRDVTYDPAWRNRALATGAAEK